MHRPKLTISNFFEVWVTPWEFFDGEIVNNLQQGNSGRKRGAGRGRSGIMALWRYHKYHEDHSVWPVVFSLTKSQTILEEALPDMTSGPHWGQPYSEILHENKCYILITSSKKCFARRLCSFPEAW